MTGRLVCLGDIMIDIHAMLPDRLSPGSDTPAPISFGHGGSAANTACWLAGLGVPTLFAGKVGDDAHGREAVARLRDHGVTTRVSIDPGTPTGVCLVLVTPDGERTMIPSAGANANLAEADIIEPPLLTEADRLHLSGYSLLTEGSRAAARAALAQAGRLGVPVSVDAASAAPIRRVGGRQMLAWLPAGALLLANADELAALTEDDPNGPAALIERGLSVIVKQGSRGAFLVTAEGQWQLPTEALDVLDSTGAGDAFAAGVLAGLHAGVGLVEAVGAGNRLGARAVGQLGGRP